METTKRTKREMKTVEEMIKLYCHDHHQTSGDELCDACKGLVMHFNESIIAFLIRISLPVKIVRCIATLRQKKSLSGR